MKRVLQEAVLVSIVGIILAFAAHVVFPRDFHLGTNYFPADTSSSPQTAVQSAPSGQTNVSPAESLAERFAKEGLQLADSNRVNALFQDPRRQQDLVVFIDARADDQYQSGHIPGAYQFDRFHADSFLPTLLPICQSAEQIVFYCNGGECEESEQAAIYVRDGAGLPKEKVFVYGGGIGEWRTNRMPVELGARNSGDITHAAPNPKP